MPPLPICWPGCAGNPLPVPTDDIVCRFIRPADWNKRDNRPKSAAFKQPGLSVWHSGRLRDNGASLESLQIEHLGGSGQAHHAAGDYIQFAAEAARLVNTAFRVQVEWRPEDEYVAQPWRQWNYAHAQVETIEGPPNFPPEFRDLLARNCRHQSPPGPP